LGVIRHRTVLAIVPLPKFEYQYFWIVKKRANYLLVIGIDRYTAPGFDPLENAVNDAMELMDVLINRYAFELCQEPIFNENATKRNIYDAFSDLVTRITENDNLLIYFAGHGWQHPITKKGYWVPYNASKNISEYIPNSEIKDYIESIKSRHTFLIVDSCFAGTFLTRTRGISSERLYTSLDDYISRWMLGSGGEETVSDGREGQHSPFAKYLLRFFTINDYQFSSAREIIRYVTTMTAQNSFQKPVGAQIENVGHQGGEMIFTLIDPWVRMNHPKSNGEPRNIILLRELLTTYTGSDEWRTGKEVILIKSFLETADLLLVELYRFDDQGIKNVSFRNDRMKSVREDGDFFEWTVLYRFATWQGSLSFWENIKENYKDKKVGLCPANGNIDEVEQTDTAIWQRHTLQDLYDANSEPMHCLHCGQMISTNESYLVEVDEVGLQPNVGNVHARCLRPVDRILGKTQYAGLTGNEKLTDFDYKKWASLAETGQGIIGQTKSLASRYNNIVLYWNQEHSFNSGEYCIQFLLSDGSREFMTLGRKVHRFSEANVDEGLAHISEQLQAAIERKDPFGFTSKQRQFGIIRQLEKNKSPAETILRISGFEKIRYSRQMETHQHITNDYAPLGLLLDFSTGEIIRLGPNIPVIANPGEFEALHANWNKVGFSVGLCSLRILESDERVDIYFRSFFDDGMQPIIDPQFNEKQEITGGIHIADSKQLEAEAKKRVYHISSDPRWKAGDRVRIIFPEVDTDNPPFGILITDEFVDDEGELCSIFSAIEDGQVRDDLTLKVPTKLLEKA
jgi:hypothetical protein